EGYPGDAFFKALDPRLEKVIDHKLSRTIFPIGAKAGELTAKASEWTGLKEGTAVAIANVDAHVSVPAATVTEPGRMVMIMGTSICHMVLGKAERTVEGMCGVVEDGIIPGLFGYEAGQSGVGDIFAWFVDHCIPETYHADAKERGINIHQLLEERAGKKSPGQHGLLALDWWNGNRSVLVDADLSGLIIGATLSTQPEDIYRALIEATAYGTRIIIEAFEKSGVKVNELVACGGLPEKNKMLMQIYADVTGRSITIPASKQTPALGSAMFGAVAAGSKAGGYDTIFEATKHMARLTDAVYQPILENQMIYDQLYIEYVRLYDYFGRGENNVMKTLKSIRNKADNN
ncbi:MAG: ribulokinase, partial [Desulfobacteraceae bacterium]|nr:ribulokinase [Desulfobacteraceae bacterium]